MSADIPGESLCSAQRFLNKVVRENGEENDEEKKEEIFKMEKNKNYYFEWLTNVFFFPPC